jgi:hypothetical protein
MSRHTGAAFEFHGAAMRLCMLIFAAAVPLIAGPARADPVYDAQTATEACLAAVIDGAPVGDAKVDQVAIHRETNPNLCAVTVTGGAPAEVRSAVLDAMLERNEGFVPAATAWDAGALASRETYCSPPGRRALALVIETGKPGASPVLVATVIEARARDQRCDLDMGLQRP